MLGPTTHVLNRSPLAGVLWHPCGVLGSCVVSVTADAVVRLWELDPKNRWSFDSPSLAVDLKRLEKGQTAQEDFSPPEDSSNRTFSADNIDLEVASVCFGGTAGSEEDVWAAMTLWIATKFGTVYALSPLLPSRWCSPIKSLQCLASSTALARASLEGDENAPAHDKQQARDQYQWSSDLMSQEARTIHGKLGSEPLRVYNRPDALGAIPKLQGPFAVQFEEDDEDIELSDIHVIPAATADEVEPDEHELIVDQPNSMLSSPSLSSSLVCLVSRIGRIYICLDLQGVKGQWLPQKNSTFAVPDEEEETGEEAALARYLMPFEVLDTLDPDDVDDAEWPTITPDIHASEAFFVTHSRGIYYLSASTWTRTLEDELLSESSQGLTTRVDATRKGIGTLREEILTFKPDTPDGFDSSPSAPILLQDSDLGYLLLTLHDSAPHSILFDTIPLDTEEPAIKPDPDSPSTDGGASMNLRLSVPASDLPVPHPRREPYFPPATFSSQSSLPRYLSSQANLSASTDRNKQLRLSPATLATLSSLHRDISSEATALGSSVADLFVTCQRLQEGLRDQIRSVRDLNNRISHVIGEDCDDYRGRFDGADTGGNVGNRIERARSRQEELMGRIGELKRNIGKLGGQSKGLSRSEEKWISNIKGLAKATIGGIAVKQTNGNHPDEVTSEDHEEADPMLPQMRARAGSECDEDSLSLSDEASNIGGAEDESQASPSVTTPSLKDRHSQAKELVERLISDIPKGPSLGESITSVASSRSTTMSIGCWEGQMHVPRDMKRRRMREVMAMLDRETALVDVTMGRLERLKAASIPT